MRVAARRRDPKSSQKAFHTALGMVFNSGVCIRINWRIDSCAPPTPDQFNINLLIGARNLALIAFKSSPGESNVQPEGKTADLGQWFSPRGTFVPSRHLAMSGNIFLLHFDLWGLLLASSGLKTGMVLSIL